MKKEIYFDHAATTKMWPQVKAAMEPYLIKNYGNASTAYDIGQNAKKALESAREKIAEIIDADPTEIYFTSGGSESDNWAIKSIAGEYKTKGMHMITTQIEHHAVLNSCEYLEELGYRVTYLPVDHFGFIHFEDLYGAITPQTTLISVMYGNNEIGTIEPIEEIGKLARRRNIIFHTDAVQAIGQVPISVKKLPVDALSASAHKFHGPKGIGFLYVRKEVDIPAFIHGGGQERGKRAGTENVAEIVGMAEALSISKKHMEQSLDRLIKLRKYFIRRVTEECDGVCLNGHPSKRLPGNVNFSFKDVNATALLVLLEEEGICASAGSACNTGSHGLSHVISAISVPQDYADGTIRFSLGWENTFAEVDYTVKCLKEDLQMLRMI